MTRNELIDQYFDWMYQLVVDNRYSKSYRKLFIRLHDTEFTYTIPMDGNRAEDGIDLRYRFGREHSYPDAVIASYLDDRPCSILEMMTALAIRCEEHIMDDPDNGSGACWSILGSAPCVTPSLIGTALTGFLNDSWNVSTDVMARAVSSLSITAVICGQRRSGIR